MQSKMIRVFLVTWPVSMLIFSLTIQPSLDNTGIAPRNSAASCKLQLPTHADTFLSGILKLQQLHAIACNCVKVGLDAVIVGEGVKVGCR